MGVRYTSPDGTVTVERVTHEMCELAIRNAGYNPVGWTIELTPITDGGVSGFVDGRPGYVDGHPIRKPWQTGPRPSAS
jgi:hypothetical protein